MYLGFSFWARILAVLLAVFLVAKAKVFVLVLSWLVILFCAFAVYVKRSGRHRGAERWLDRFFLCWAKRVKRWTRKKA
ncbi:MAG: hypothetical protein LBT92_02415 [Rickettsiales bacterium]|jgi:hypothetical protein|nr:hypothetical protein [Rickettsiales bacterium]